MACSAARLEVVGGPVGHVGGGEVVGQHLDIAGTMLLDGQRHPAVEIEAVERE